MFTYSMIIERHDDNGRGDKARIIHFEHDENDVKCVYEIIETDVEGDFKAAERALRRHSKYRFLGTPEQFKAAWNARKTVDMRPGVVQPEEAPGRTYKDELIDHVFELLTMAPIKGAEIMDILEAVKAKVAAIPRATVEEN